VFLSPAAAANIFNHIFLLLQETETRRLPENEPHDFRFLDRGEER
jgi:hypothetical protein